MTSRTQSQVRVGSVPQVLVVVGAFVALLCAWWALARGVEYVGEALRFPAPLDGQEGMALWEADLLRSGRGLYLPVVPGYFVSAPYPPVHPLLLALFAGGSTPHVFWSGRIISLVAGVLVAVAGFSVVQRVTGSKLGGLATTLLLLSFTPVQLWSLRIKPDMVGLLFTVVGLGFAAMWQGMSQTHTRRLWFGLPMSLIAAASAFVVAHFSKQTMLAGPLAVGTYLLLHDRRMALRWGLVYLGLLGLVWALLDLITHGQYTYHVWVLHKLDWTVGRMWKLTLLLADTWPLIILGLVGLVACWRRPTVINAYLLYAPASLIGAGVVGSHHNHLLETGTALALAGGQALGLALGTSSSSILRILAPVLLAVQLLLWREPQPWFEGDYKFDQEYARYIEFVRATPGEVMADDVGMVYAAGRPLAFDDPAAMGPAAKLGLWDQSEFVAAIRAQRFSALILRVNVKQDGPRDMSGRWTPEMLQAVRDSYDLKFNDTFKVYVPKSPTP